MKKHILALSLFIFSALSSFSQKEANIWCFGDSAGLDFNSGSPVPFNGVQMNTNEGCASIADKTTGQLLFYTDGISVWDRTHNIMPGSIPGLYGNWSSTQSALIVPLPGSTTLYYIFTVDAQAGYFLVSLTGYGGVAYSIVDMSLNGGLGDISTLNTTLIAPTSEKVTAVRHCNGRDIWIVTHQWNTNSFYAYLLTNTGLSAPVITNSGIVHQDVGSGSNAEAIGHMKFSPNGKKLALVCYEELNTVQIFDFDNSTGIISNPITDTNFPNLTGQDGPYGISFSPDNSRLYVGVFGYTTFGGTSYVYQYNMLAGTNAAILASKTVVNTNTTEEIGALQIGPDGKIYVAKTESQTGSSYLDVIKNPNALGAACNYMSNGFYLGGIGLSNYGLPDMVESYLSVPFTATLSYTDCSGSHTVSFTDNALNGGISTTWNFGDPASGTSDTSSIQNPSHTFSSSSSYSVTVHFSTSCQVDSFTQTVIAIGGGSASAGPDTSVCSGNDVQLHASAGTSWHWSPGTGLSDSTIINPIAIPLVTTTYTVTVIAGGCSSMATVTITVHQSPPTPTIVQSHDTLFCSFDPTYTSYQWYYNDTLIKGATNPYFIEAKNGNYNVAVSNENGCLISVGIIIDGIPTISSKSNITLYPNPVRNELLLSGYLPAGRTVISIYNVLGQLIYSSGETPNSLFRKAIDVSTFSKGVYVIQVQQAEGEWARRFVKE